MQSTTITVTASDGTALSTQRWLPEGPPRAVVQIAHGMAEHAARYARLAEALTAAGYAVYANDHRGHGATASKADHGYFADEHGWDTVVADLRAVTDVAREENPGLPVFLLGHSMGSFLSRAYVIEDSRELSGLVLSGTAGDPGLLGKVGGLVAATEARLRGRRHVSTLLDKLTFGQYNAAFSAQPHRLRLAVARRGRGRPLRRRRAVRQHLHLGLLRRPARGPRRHQRPPPGGPGAP